MTVLRRSFGIRFTFLTLLKGDYKLSLLGLQDNPFEGFYEEDKGKSRTHDSSFGYLERLKVLHGNSSSLRSS